MFQITKILAISLIIISNIIAQTVPVTLHYEPEITEFTTLRLVGNFNGWNNGDDEMIMTDPDGDGVYEITKDFTKGVEHMYKFVFDANWSFAWNDPDNPDIKISDNNNSILNVTDPYITYLLPRGRNSAYETYFDKSIEGEPIRAIFAYTEDNPIDLNTLIVTIDGIPIDNPTQYYIEEKKEFFYQTPTPLPEGNHTIVVSITSPLGTVTKTSTFKRKPGLIVYKTPLDFFYDENNTGSSIIQNINSVSLVGDFNNWNELFDKMQDNNSDGLWEVTSYLEEGSYEYKFKLNGGLWINDPDEPSFSVNTDNNQFSVVIDSIPSIKLTTPNESTTFKIDPAEFSFEALLRPGAKWQVDEASIIVRVNNVPVTSTYFSDTSLVTSAITLTGEGNHQVSIEFTNSAGLSASETFTYGIYTNETGFYYADAIDDEPYSYPAGVPQGSCDIISVLIDEVQTHDSLMFTVEFENISDRTRLGLLITNQVSNSAADPLELEILTEDWQNNGVFVPIGKPGNSYENTLKENRFWEGRDPVVISDKALIVNSDGNNLEFAISVAYLDSLLGSWTRERNFYLFSYLANDDMSGNGFEVTSNEGGSDSIEDPDIYDAAFFRSGFWQDRVFSNYIPAGGKMGPRFVSLNGDGRGQKSLSASDISDSLATYGPAIIFLTPSVTYWYQDVIVKGTISDPDITEATFSFNGVESSVTVKNSEFAVPVLLEEGENVIFVRATDNKGFESTSKNIVLSYERDAEPTVTISGALNGRSVSLTANASSPDGLDFTYSWIDDENNPAYLFGTASSKTIQFDVPAEEGEYYIDVVARDSQGKTTKARKLIFAKNDSVYFAQINDHASWIDEAIFYEIYPRSYSPTGNFEGIKNKIPDMVDLGINAIWFMPIYTGPTPHGYEITDYFGFEEDFGDADDFRDLMESLHAAGIKVILDFVVNHTSIQHRFMQNVLEYKENSPWADFYLWDGEAGNSNYEYFFDWASLPNLNHNNKDVREYFIKAAKYWITEFDIDGYRCDVAWGVEERNSDFWQEWRTALKNIKPEVFLQAEASSSQNIYYSNRFDSANDWDLRNKIIGATNNTTSINTLDSELRKNYLSYARPFRFVENHDEVRVASSHDTQRSKLMHTILLTASGVPLIYSGGEVGEVTNRGLIDWSDPDNIRPYFKSLVKIRNNYLSNPILDRVENSYPNTIYTYSSTSGDNILLTYANFSAGNNSGATINKSELPNDGTTTYYLTNLFDGEVIEIPSSTTDITLEPLDGYEAVVYYYGTEPVIVDINEEDNLIVSDYQLSQNYPNPFNPSTKITYQIPDSGLVTLKVYDVLGREVAELVNSEQPTGKYTVTLNGANLSSGIYFYTMRAGDFVATKKLLLLK
ncbi:MAG: T9SS type A sorting domain-containing protein [Melioribacteraceae bacterium]|nr:T9SS type A sorting domain-containing protein [Melioribacteraceae bacterium]